MSSAYQFSSYDEHVSQLRCVVVLDGKMMYLDVGEGPAILLLHGVPNSSWLYRKMVNPLVDAGFRVIVPDMLGYGVSEKPKDQGVYHTRKQGDRILTLMAELNIPNWIHVCHDAGGPWTWQLLLKQPARVNHLVCLNTILYNDGFHPPFRRHHGSLFVRLFARMYSSKILAPVVMRSYWAANCKNVQLSKEERDGYIRPLVADGHHSLQYFFSDFFEIEKLLPQIQEALRHWTRPITVIWGAQDKTLVHDEQIPLLLNDLQKVKPTVHILEEGSHLIQEELPNIVVKQINQAILR